MAVRKYLFPIIVVFAGIALSWGLQATGMVPLLAKLIALAGVLAVIAVNFWRRARA